MFVLSAESHVIQFDRSQKGKGKIMGECDHIAGMYFDDTVRISELGSFAGKDVLTVKFKFCPECGEEIIFGKKEKNKGYLGGIRL